MNSLAIRNFEEVEVNQLPNAIQERDDVLTGSKDITVIDSEFTFLIAADSFASLAEIARSVERSRVAVKNPVLELGRKIDSVAKDFLTEVVTEHSRLDKLITVYRDKQRKNTEEQLRLQNERLAQIEREKREAEAAEVKRLADIANAETARKQAELDAQTAFTPKEAVDAAAEANRAVEEHNRLVAEGEAQKQRQADLAKQQQAVQRQVIVAPQKVAGLTERKVWKFEVMDIHAVYANTPGLCRLEINASAVNEQIRTGLRECIGMRIYQETQNQNR